MKKKDKNNQETDMKLIEQIQPRGGITFKDPGHITAGDGYIKVVHIYRLPKTLSTFWLDRLFNIEGTVAVMDSHAKNVAEVKKNINRSLQEEFSRERSAKDFMEAYDAQMRSRQLTAFYDELSRGEVPKMVHFRIYVPGRNLEKLEEKVEEVMQNLEADSFMPTVLLNEGKREWQALFESYSRQHARPFYIKGHPLSAGQIAYGDPFHYAELKDRNGTLLGFTHYGGAVLFDEFEKSDVRTHYNSMVCGEMGSGKSTLLKKRFICNAISGNFVRCFDATGEFEDLTKEMGGRIIKCNGTEGMLNPLEILRAGDSDVQSYTRHITKVTTFFRCIMPSITDSTILDLQNLLTKFYETLDLAPGGTRPITGLPAAEYPTFSELLKFCRYEVEELLKKDMRNDMEKELSKTRLSELLIIGKATENIVKNFGSMFNGHTTVDNIEDEKIVTFDISGIKDLGNVFTAQMFNMVSLCWDNAVQNGMKMKDAYEKDLMDERDISKFLILIDESHRWINSRMPMILERIQVYMKEARKYFAGITFATQSIRDYFPEGLNAPNVDMLKEIFQLTQYKFIFKQSGGSKELIGKIFQDSLTPNQIARIESLGMGQTILSISGDRSIAFDVWQSREYEEPLFRGGR